MRVCLNGVVAKIFTLKFNINKKLLYHDILYYEVFKLIINNGVKFCEISNVKFVVKFNMKFDIKFNIKFNVKNKIKNKIENSVKFAIKFNIKFIIKLN